MLNRVNLMGRLTRDPELRRTQAGTPVTTITIAVERDYAKGERETDFFEVVAWRNDAEFICNYFSKGRMIVVDGKLQAREWTDKEGNKKKSVEVVAEHVYFGDSKKEDTGGYYNNTGGYTSPVTPSAFSEYDDDDDDEECPF